MEPIGFQTHDHSHCITQTVAQAEAYCAEHGLQLTPVRRRVLEILLQEHSAMGAYDILDVLRTEGLGSQPPVAYRALDFLVTHGFVHKIERLNAFTACTSPGTAHSPAFFVCRSCEGVAETVAHPDMDHMSQLAKNAGFKISQVVVEVMGQCRACQEAKPA